MSSADARQEPYRFLEDRFTCAQACAECARACALGASDMDPDGGDGQEKVRRQAIMCAEVCDATCRVLDECQDEDGIRVQLEWCRDVCLDCVRALDGRTGTDGAAAACRDCARACDYFVGTLN
ncbi:ferredoxin [Streptomyces sp. NPDC086787]|uniref:ferredoxin n=1 Tax=Streptomyces sp. NPDC086787 TaxID=3365759 RepID=UPI003819AD3A